MNTFPTLDRGAQFPITESYYKPQTKSEFESGHVQSRARATVGKYRWSLTYKSLENSDWTLLLDFFKNNIGALFNWTHPISEDTHIVRFTDNELKSVVKVNNLRDVTLNIEEAP